MTTLVFEIFGEDHGATRTFKEIGDSSDEAGRKLKGFGDDTDTLADKFQRLNLGSLTGGGGIGGAVSALAPAILPAVSAVGLLSGALGVVPAAAGFAVTGLAAVTIGTSGVSDAIKAYSAAQDAGFASMAAFNAEMAKLTPNAQGAVRTLIGLRSSWTDLKNSVQERLFAGLGEEIQHVAAADLPVLKVGLADVAGSINDNVIQFGHWASSAQTLADTAAIFDNNAKAGHNLAAAVAPVMDIIRDIATVGSQFLPGLATGFAQGAQRAADFIAHARETGQLKQWIQTGIDAFKTLMGIVGDLIVIVKDLMAGPGGSDLLTLLGLVSGSIRWFLDNVPGATVIVEAFIVAWKVAQIAQAISKVVDATKIWSVVTGIQTAATWALDAANLPVILTIGGIVLAIGAVIAIGYLLITHWQDVKRIAGDVWGWITDKFWSIVGWFKNAGTWLFDAGRNLVIGLWNGIMSWAGELWSRITGWLDGVWKGIKGFFGISSPSTLMAQAGESIAAGLAAGIDTQAHLAVTAAGGMASGVSDALSGIEATASLGLAGSAGIAPPGAASRSSVPGAPQPVRVEVGFDFSTTGASGPLASAMLELFRQAIRVRGGNVQQVLGS